MGEHESCASNGPGAKCAQDNGFNVGVTQSHSGRSSAYRPSTARTDLACWKALNHERRLTKLVVNVTYRFTHSSSIGAARYPTERMSAELEMESPAPTVATGVRHTSTGQAKNDSVPDDQRAPGANVRLRPALVVKLRCDGKSNCSAAI